MCQSTRPHILEYLNLHRYRCENFESHISLIYSKVDILEVWSPSIVDNLETAVLFYSVERIILSVWYCMHRASSYNMYINQQDAHNSYNYTLFSIRCSTCFGLYQSIIRSNFISCTPHLVYADTIRVDVVSVCHPTHTDRPSLKSNQQKFGSAVRLAAHSAEMSLQRGNWGSADGHEHYQVLFSGEDVISRPLQDVQGWISRL